MSLSCYLAYRDPCVFRFICFPIFKQHLPTYPKDYFMAIFKLSDYVTWLLVVFIEEYIFVILEQSVILLSQEEIFLIYFLIKSERSFKISDGKILVICDAL